MTDSPNSASVDDYNRILGMVSGSWVAQVIRATATLQVAERLAAGIDTAATIAEAEGADRDAVRRLLRALVSLHLVDTADGVHYTATSALNILRADSPRSLRGMALSMAGPGHWLPWGRFPDAIRGGRDQIVAAHGVETIFAYLAANVEEAQQFTEAMQNLGEAEAVDIEDVLDTRGVRFALDVGGANGRIVRSLMRANPNLRGGVYDLAHVTAAADEAALEEGLDRRFSAISGDFFQSVPAADLYILKYVLHDWDDDSCVRILENCRKSVEPGGRVVIMDYLVDGGEPFAALMDMCMLVMSKGGRERDLSEFDSLFGAAGLRRTKVGRAGVLGVIETVATG
jgi:O-methyltransferase/methyltransferase family protein